MPRGESGEVEVKRKRSKRQIALGIIAEVIGDQMPIVNAVN